LPFRDPSAGVIFQSAEVSGVNLARKSAKPMNEFYQLKQARQVSERADSQASANIFPCIDGCASITSLTYLVVQFINLGLADASLEFHYGYNLVSRSNCTHSLIQIKVLCCSERSIVWPCNRVRKCSGCSNLKSHFVHLLPPWKHK
jgi:hypothetical protein